jgi:hypothetical protein
MSLWKGPVRWVQDGSGAPVELRKALRSAQTELGSREQVRRLAQRMEPELTRFNSSIPPGAALIGNHTTVFSIKTLLSVFAVAAAGVVAVSYLRFGTPPASSVKNQQPASTKMSADATDKKPIATARRTFDLVIDAQEAERELANEVAKPTPKSIRRRAKPAAPITVPAPNMKLDPEDELRILQHAQDNLTIRPLSALQSSEQHLRDYPSGVFAQEREMIAIEALFLLNRVDQGVDRAKRFLEKFNNSTHAPRVRSLLEGAEKTGHASTR